MPSATPTLVLVLTEWPAYTSLDPAVVGDLVRDPRVLDGRNCLDAAPGARPDGRYRARSAVADLAQ